MDCKHTSEDKKFVFLNDNKRPPSTRAESVIAWFTVVLTFVGIGAGYATFLQWQAADKALKLATDSASDGARDTQAALSISSRVASAAEQQSRTNQLALSASLNQAEVIKLMAETAEKQAETARKELELKQNPNVDMVIHMLPFTEESGFRAFAQISNSGNYSIRGATVDAASEVLDVKNMQSIWRLLKGPDSETNVIDIVPNVEHNINLILPPLTDTYWRNLASHKIAVVHAIRLKFKDASNEEHIIQRCIAYSGDGTPSNLLRQFCPDK